MNAGDPVTRAVQAHVPSAAQGNVLAVAYHSAAGYQTREIAGIMELPWPEVNKLREQAGDALITAMRGDGYGDIEIIRTLGVPTARVVGSAPAG
jgi:hypothetical protein